MSLADTVQGALTTARDLIGQTGVTLSGVVPGYLDEVTQNYIGSFTFSLVCPNAVVLPYKQGGGLGTGGYADVMVDGSKLMGHSRKVLLSEVDLAGRLPLPDDTVEFEGFTWAILGVSSLGGLVTVIVTR